MRAVRLLLRRGYSALCLPARIVRPVGPWQALIEMVVVMTFLRQALVMEDGLGFASFAGWIGAVGALPYAWWSLRTRNYEAGWRLGVALLQVTFAVYALEMHLTFVTAHPAYTWFKDGLWGTYREGLPPASLSLLPTLLIIVMTSQTFDRLLARGFLAREPLRTLRYEAFLRGTAAIHVGLPLLLAALVSWRFPDDVALPLRVLYHVASGVALSTAILTFGHYYYLRTSERGLLESRKGEVR